MEFSVEAIRISLPSKCEEIIAEQQQKSFFCHRINSTRISFVGDALIRNNQKATETIVCLSNALSAIELGTWLLKLHSSQLIYAIYIQMHLSHSKKYQRTVAPKSLCISTEVFVRMQTFETIHNRIRPRYACHFEIYSFCCVTSLRLCSARIKSR